MSHIEACCTPDDGFLGCTAELTSAETGIPIGAGLGEVAIVDETVDGYEITATSKATSGGAHTYTITHNIGGVFAAPARPQVGRLRESRDLVAARRVRPRNLYISSRFTARRWPRPCGNVPSPLALKTDSPSSSSWSPRWCSSSACWPSSACSDGLAKSTLNNQRVAATNLHAR